MSEGVISPMCQFFGKITSMGLVFMTVNRKCTGNFVQKILRRGSMDKFCSNEDCVLVQL